MIHKFFQFFIPALVLTGCVHLGRTRSQKQTTVIATPEKKNFRFTSVETCDNPELDMQSFSEVIINRTITNRTPAANLSEEKSVSFTLPEGNHLMQIQKFVYIKEWEDFFPIRPEYQPRERFILIRSNDSVHVLLRYAPLSRRYEMSVQYE